MAIWLKGPLEAVCWLMFPELTMRIDAKWQKLRDRRLIKSRIQSKIPSRNTKHGGFREDKKARSKAKERSLKIDQEIAKDLDDFKNRTRVLILGTRHSSQSTLLRQIRYIQDGGFSNDERINWRRVIYWWLFDVYTAIQSSEQHEHLLVCLSQVPEMYNYSSPLPPTLVDGLKRLFDIASAIKATSSDHCYETLKYFSRQVDRLLEPFYLPTDEDIFHTYVNCGTVDEAVLQFQGGKIQVHELGTLHNLRRLRKGGYDFEGTDVVLLVYPLDTYDDIRWDTNTAMQHDSMYYGCITSSRWFRKATFVLCFTKLDIFMRKIESGDRPFSQYFPDYSGDPYDINAILEYISDMFQASVAEESGGGGILPVYYLDATKTDQVRGLLGLVEWVIANRGP